MSDNWICIIPTDPSFVPTSAAAARGVALLAQFAPSSESGEPSHAVDEEEVVFVDAGSNFSSITCPWCQAPVDIDWWVDRVTLAHASRFTDLMIRTRCCDVTTSLNELVYDWPQGFARWRLEVMNPTVATLTAAQLSQIGTAIGHDVRAVLVHI